MRGCFPNKGGTCYLSATLQFAFHNDASRSAVRSHARSEACGAACQWCAMNGIEAEWVVPSSRASTEALAPFLSEHGLVWRQMNDASQVMHTLSQRSVRAARTSKRGAVRMVSA